MRFLSRGHDAHASAENVHRYGSQADGTRNTIHASSAFNIEVDDEGRPTALWFRCLNLPFTVWRRADGEALEFNPQDMEVLNVEYRRDTN